MSSDLASDGVRPEATLDPFDVRLAADAPDVLRPFNQAGVLSPADVHAAVELCRLVGEPRPEVLLATALAVRAPQHGHVCVELSRAAESVTAADDAPVPFDALVWPDPAEWRRLIADSPLVVERPRGTPVVDPTTDRPLSLVDDRLYLDRYWRYERRVAVVLRRRADRTVDDVDASEVRAALDRLLPPSAERPDRQRLAVATGVTRALTVIAGGPGTGKTHTVARLLALVHELHDSRDVRVAVAAPTGKAADRLTAALRAAADSVDTSPAVRDRLRALEGTTIHRLLGWAPGSDTRFQHSRDRKLPHDLVVVDETSMVDLPLMAKLLVALRPTTRLVLVGDPDQLASVEAGAVLSDIVGPSDGTIRKSSATRERLEACTGESLSDVAPARPDGIDDAVVVLGTVRRYREGSGIGSLARAIHAGDPDAAVEVLRSGTDDAIWIEVPSDEHGAPLSPVRTAVAEGFRGVLAHARSGRGSEALEHLDRLRVLCAHRRGPAGVAGWVPLLERWLTEDVAGFDPTGRWYVGRPVMVTRNDRRLHLFNGDVGVVVQTASGRMVAFRGSDGIRMLTPSRLEDVETVHAMTIHKSQGSEFDHVVVVLPDEDSPILTRELLYTAVTRARSRVTVIGEEAVVRAAAARPIARAAGLRETLWGG